MAEAPGNKLESVDRSVSRPRYRYGTGPAASSAVVSATATAASIPVLDYAAGLPPLRRNDIAWLLIGAAVIGLAFYLLFWINCHFLVITWARDASWSHGFAVPVLSAVLINMQWDRLRRMPIKGSRIGLMILIYGVASQVLFRITGQEHLSNMSIVVVFLGAALLIFGWEYMRVLWLPICFLLFMIPFPKTVYVKITTPLQNIAATAGTVLLPLFGIDADRAGTTLEISRNGHMDQLNVAEACSGIRSLMAFVALAVVLAYTTPRPMWQKILLVLCAIPVAIFCNALRVTLTGVLDMYAGAAYSKGSTHEMLGFLMLIPAGAIQLGIAWALDRIFVEDSPVVLRDVKTGALDSQGGGR